MNKKLTAIWCNKGLMWEIGTIFVSAVCSGLCAVLTQDIFCTVVYIAITASIDMIAGIEAKMEGLIPWEKLVGAVFQIDNRIKYSVCVVFAMLPTLVGICTKEIVFSGIGSIPSLFFVNIFPNECGALMVCSLITYISKLNEQEFVLALLRSKRCVFNIVFRAIFFSCYLNAVNYRVDNGWNYANIMNSIYLFFIILFGAIAAISFFFRLVDQQPFPYTVKQAFPYGTLFFSDVFLFSCGAAPLIAKVGKHEPVLLLLNTFTVFVVFGGLLYFLSCKTDKSEKEYPIIEFLVAIIFAVFNCAINLLRWDREGDVFRQIVSGLLFLGLAVFLLLFTRYCHRRNQKKLEENREGTGSRTL